MKNYVSPELHVVAMATADIICISGDPRYVNPDGLKTADVMGGAALYNLDWNA